MGGGTDSAALLISCQVDEFSHQALKAHGNERGCIALDGFMQMVASKPWSALLDEDRVNNFAPTVNSTMPGHFLDL